MSQKTKMNVIGAISLLSGVCNSLLGAGGGILLSLAMGKLLQSDEFDRRDILSTSQAAMIPGCIASCVIYGVGGQLDTSNFAVFALPALAGGAVGSILMDKIRPKWIGRIFSLFIIFSGARMLMR